MVKAQGSSSMGKNVQLAVICLIIAPISFLTCKSVFFDVSFVELSGEGKRRKDSRYSQPKEITKYEPSDTLYWTKLTQHFL